MTTAFQQLRLLATGSCAQDFEEIAESTGKALKVLRRVLEDMSQAVDETIDKFEDGFIASYVVANTKHVNLAVITA